MNKSAIRNFAVTAKRELTDFMQENGLRPDAAGEAAYAWFVHTIESEYLRIHAIPPADAQPDALPPAYRALRPDVLLADAGSLMQLLHTIPETDWQAVQILGWLHQFYHADAKDQVFADLKRNIKITARTLPAATQLFTPDWIVQYLTDTSLGLLFPSVRGALSYFAAGDALPAAHRAPEQIRLLDPCTGCGNILVYAFDVLMQVYRAAGWQTHDAVRAILTRNLYGLDIDRRAIQLCRFALRMKAQQYCPGILREGLEPHLGCFAGLPAPDDVPDACRAFAAGFRDADSLGSLLSPKPYEGTLPADLAGMQDIAHILSQSYDAVITNPPYMGSARMSRTLSDFVRTRFPRSKSDLFACFIERCMELTRPGGYCAMITQQSWMFLQSFTELRQALLHETFVSLLHLGQNAFEMNEVGTIVQTAAFVLRHETRPGYRGCYYDLCAFRSPEEKRLAFLAGNAVYHTDQQEFSRLPRSLFAYWASDAAVRAFEGQRIGDLATPRQGMTTSDNKRFIRHWFEVERQTICFGATDRASAQASGCRWFPYNKGGGYRKWYGNHDYVINFEDDGKELRAFHAMLNKDHSGGRIKNQEYYFRPSLTWTFIANTPGFRACPAGFIFDVAGSSLFAPPAYETLLLAFLCSKVTRYFLGIINPTMNIQAADIKALPFIAVQDERIAPLVRENIALCRRDWDSFETSWDFTAHPLFGRSPRLCEAFAQWAQECEERFRRLQANEETLNRIFIDAYGLQQELSPAVPDAEITVRRADRTREIRSLLSYAVGCVFGRFGDNTDAPDALPVEGGAHSLTAQVIAFLSDAFGAEALPENLQYIAETLGGKGTPRDILARYLGSAFYHDHCRIYQKRPVYWLMHAGDFRAIAYLHRMQPDTLRHIRQDMLLPHLRQQRSLYQQQCRQSETLPLPQRRKQERILLHLRQSIEAESAFDQTLCRTAANPPLLHRNDGVTANLERFAGIFAPVRR